MQQRIVKVLSTYRNLILALTILKQEIDTDIQNNNLSNQHSQLNKLDSCEVINNYKNFGSDKYFVICDCIIGDV
jgi:hypothetical protein